MPKPIVLAKVAALCWVFAASPIVDAKKIDPSALEARAIESRRFDNASDKQIAAACIATLQDMGFNIDSSDVELGYVTASKSWTPNTLKSTGKFTSTPDNAMYQERYRVSVTLRSSAEKHAIASDKPSAQSLSYVVRAVFQEAQVTGADKNGPPVVMKGKTILDPDIYQEFFQRLSKSLFVEGQQL